MAEYGRQARGGIPVNTEWVHTCNKCGIWCLSPVIQVVGLESGAGGGVGGGGGLISLCYILNY